MKYLILSLILLTNFVCASDKDTVPLKSATKASKKESMTDDLAKWVNKNGEAKKQAVDPSIPESEESEEAVGPAKPFVASVDTFGSSRINEVILKETLGKDLQVWLDAGIKGDPKSLDLEKKLTEKVVKKFGFASADWSIIQYFEPGNLAIHITLDVVEAADVSKRMPFLPAPKGELKGKEFADALKLVELWLEYEDKALNLVEAGALEPESEQCPAFHCPFGHKHADLKKYETLFVDGVKAQADKLIRIQKEDPRPEHRGAATYLLAYLKDGNQVISAMVERIKDPDPLVRNNALRVLGDVAEFHPELLIPIQPVLDALEFPRVSDRSKAAYLVYLLSLNSSQVRGDILKRSVPALLQMLASKQPDHRDLAHGVLRKISGKDYTAQQVQSWANWYQALSKDRAIAKKP